MTKNGLGPRVMAKNGLGRGNTRKKNGFMAFFIDFGINRFISISESLAFKTFLVSSLCRN
jgi:hypothetical protein